MMGLGRKTLRLNRKKMDLEDTAEVMCIVYAE